MKRQASFKEYTVTIADSGSAEVYKLFKNALKGLQELCEANKIDYPEYMGAQKLGTKLLKEQNGGDATAVSAIVGQYIVSREPNNSIKVSKIYKNTSGALRELSELVGFDYDAKWGPRTFGNKVIDAIESGEFKKLAKAKKIEDTVEIEMGEDSAEAEVAAPQAAAQEIPADAVVLQPKNPEEIGEEEFEYKKFTCVVIPNGVKTIEQMGFWGCENLQRVILPEGLEVIEGRAFRNCYELTEINIPASVTKIDGSAFDNCDKLDLGAIYKLEDGIAYNKDKTEVIKVVNPVNLVLPETITEIKSRQFAGCETLESIILPEGLVSIGEYAFLGSGLKSIVIPNSIKKLEDCLFERCGSIESIILPEGLTEIGFGVFMGCYPLESITIPSTVTKIGACAFAYTGGDVCDNSIAMDHLEICFEGGCEEIDGVVYNNDCTEIFYITEDAVAVVIPEGITSLEGKFRGADCLRSIDLSESDVRSFDDYEFEVCERLSEVIFPDDFESIGENAFSGTRVSGDSLPEQFQDNLEDYGIWDNDEDYEDDEDWDD